MDVSVILRNQIKAVYGQSVKTKLISELGAVEIPNCGRLIVNNKLEIQIEFVDFKFKNPEVIRLFFQPRIKSDYMRIYLDFMRFRAFPITYKTKSIGAFDLAMEYFSVYKSIHDSLNEYLSYQ